MANQPTIGAHLATLNLFLEPDGTVEITVAGQSPAFRKMWEDSVAAPPAPYITPISMIEALIIKAAERMAARRSSRTRG